jgi:hypothetical protein
MAFSKPKNHNGLQNLFFLLFAVAMYTLRALIFFMLKYGQRAEAGDKNEY